MRPTTRGRGRAIAATTAARAPGKAATLHGDRLRARLEAAAAGAPMAQAAVRGTGRAAGAEGVAAVDAQGRTASGARLAVASQLDATRPSTVVADEDRKPAVESLDAATGASVDDTGERVDAIAAVVDQTAASAQRVERGALRLDAAGERVGPRSRCRRRRLADTVAKFEQLATEFKLTHG